jgi:hypothetical protein
MLGRVRERIVWRTAWLEIKQPCSGSVTVEGSARGSGLTSGVRRPLR